MQTAFRSQLELRQKGNFMKPRKKNPPLDKLREITAKNVAKGGAITEKPVKKVKADATAVKDEAMKLYERYMDFTLMDALAGEFHIEDDLKAKAAFDQHDVDALTVLCYTHGCKVDFVEPDEILPARAARLKPIKLKNGKTRRRTMDDFTTAERYEILRKHDGTRAYARVLLDAQGGGTPFDD